MVEILLKIVLAALFASACAYAYLRLARRRENVRKHAILIFGALFVFSFLRLISTD